jgi:hypothetical protein
MKPPIKSPFKKNSSTTIPYNGFSLLKSQDIPYNNKDIIKFNNNKLKELKNPYSSLENSKIVKKYNNSKFSVKIGGGGVFLNYKTKF